MLVVRTDGRDREQCVAAVQVPKSAALGEQPEELRASQVAARGASEVRLPEHRALGDHRGRELIQSHFASIH